MSWSPEQYVIFEDERTRPVRDLLNAIPSADPHSAVDLGCGPGNSTEVLAARFPNTAVMGLDSSADMIAKARKRLPGLRFDVASIEAWNDAGPFDVIFANAVLQWVPNHDILLPRLVSKLAPSGSLAVQMPDNLDEPAHQLMREVAAQGPWAAKLANAAASRTPSKNAGWYYSLLKPYSARVDIWRTVYHHPLAGGADAIVEWFKGSGLLPFLTPLEEGERNAYLDRYRASVARAYPAQPDGTVLLPFPRLFMVATR